MTRRDIIQEIIDEKDSELSEIAKEWQRINPDFNVWAIDVMRKNRTIDEQLIIKLNSSALYEAVEDFWELYRKTKSAKEQEGLVLYARKLLLKSTLALKVEFENKCVSGEIYTELGFSSQ